jgi:hypothetical protein
VAWLCAQFEVILNKIAGGVPRNGWTEADEFCLRLSSAVQIAVPRFMETNCTNEALRAFVTRLVSLIQGRWCRIGMETAGVRTPVAGVLVLEQHVHMLGPPHSRPLCCLCTDSCQCERSCGCPHVSLLCFFSRPCMSVSLNDRVCEIPSHGTR